jgi:hypothetical protein
MIIAIYKRGGSEMKKLMVGIVTIAILINLTGCIYKPGQRPTEYSPAIWRSEDPDIWFEVLEYDQDRSYQTIGQLTIGGNVYSFSAFFNYGSGVNFRDTEDYTIRYFKGSCIFGPDKLVVKVDPKYDYIFNGSVKEITFIRTEISK